MKLGDRVLSIGKKAVRRRARDLPRSLPRRSRESRAPTVEVVWRPAGGETRTAALVLEPEPPGDALVWKSARVIRRGGKAYGYARLWGMSAETALALVDLLSDRAEAARAKPELAGLDAIEGFLLDVRGNSGGYDPDILTTFLRGRWSAGDYWVEQPGRPPARPAGVQAAARRAPRQLGDGERGRGARAEVPAPRDRPDRRRGDGGDALGRRELRARSPDGSTLWLSARAIEDDARAAPTRAGPSRRTSSVADRPAAKPGGGRRDRRGGDPGAPPRSNRRPIPGSRASRPTPLSTRSAILLHMKKQRGTRRPSSASATTAASRWPPTARSRSARPS